jgi:hypothetical protein
MMHRNFADVFQMPKAKTGNDPGKNAPAVKKARTSTSCHLQPFYRDRAGCVAAFSHAGDDNVPSKHLVVGEKPFPYCVMRQLLEEPFLPELRQELSGLRLREKNNDLYRFRQSGELKRAAGPCVAALRETLLGQVKPIVSEVTLFFNSRC